MNVLILRANPRKIGHTQRLTDLFIEGLKEGKAKVNEAPEWIYPGRVAHPGGDQTSPRDYFNFREMMPNKAGYRKTGERLAEIGKRQTNVFRLMGGQRLLQ